MHQDPVQEAIVVTIFMGGLNEGVARTEFFRSHPSTFEEAVAIALRAEFDFKPARVSTPVYRSNYWNASVAPNMPEPMDLSLVEAGEETLQAADHHTAIRRCYMCGSTNTYVRLAPYVMHVKLVRAIIPTYTRNLVQCGKTSTPSRRGAPCWGRPRLYSISRR